MKIRYRSVFLIPCLVFILVACSRPIEKKLAGTWKVEDLQYKSEMPLDPEMMAQSKEAQKGVSIELLEDGTAKIIAGQFSTINGNWLYKEKDNSVYMVFQGTRDTVVFGKYEDGKLINVQNMPNLELTTIFAKEKK